MTSNASTMAQAQARSAELSALQLTRAAIARWRGSAPAASLPRDQTRVSPQARHLARAQRDLAAWMAMGGFAQEGNACAPAACGWSAWDSAPCLPCASSCAR
ncbi:hypothetical protein [Massilia sp. CF038]|uniref:hypothetical protein n=1 Tax=Massilia sp. CF038 TaxID=1881045 RepID=UPI000934AF09|nr:hypothetical protein [Massilia sp. CF038]